MSDALDVSIQRHKGEHMKFAAFFAIVVFAMSSTSFANCGPRTGGSLFKSTVAPSSLTAAAATATQTTVQTVKAVR